MTNTADKSGNRSVARLSAVQALYQLELSENASAPFVAREFREHRLNQKIDEEQLADADVEFFEDVVRGTAKRREEIDALLEGALSEKWSLKRLETVMACILRAGIYELMARPDVPTAVVIDEYLDIAHAFYSGTEPGFVNGVLDRLAKDLRT